MKSRINKIGFEIEGEFSQELATNIRNDFRGNFKGDGSIDGCCGHLTSMEFASDPYSVRSFLPKVKKLFLLLKRKRTQGEYHWNDSCGFHIHVSFAPKIPEEIVSREFVKYFNSEMARVFSKEWKDRKDNTYCVGINHTDEHLAGLEGGGRYYSVNICSALARHGTIEFRIFPADSGLQMFKYLHFTIKTIKDFIADQDSILNRKFAVNFERKVKKEIIKQTTGN